MLPLRDSQPSASTPVVTTALVVLNVFAFLFQFSLDPFTRNDLIAVFGFVPDRFSWLDIVTSMFLHGGWLHLIGNMLFLWVLGDNVEDILGHGKYLLFYLLCGAAAALGQYALDPNSRIPMVGASGAIAGVMGAYMLKFPHSRIKTLVFIILFVTIVEVPAGLMLAYWFVLQFFSGVGSIATYQGDRGGTAFFAHIGGFVAGMALIYLMRPRQRYRLRRDLAW